MFNNHTMSLVTDLDMLQREAMNIDYVTVAAITTGQYPEGPNIFYAGILVPTTDMLMRWTDGDPGAIPYEYPQYLLSKDCDDMIVAIIAAMTKKNIILYIPHDEFLVYGEVLLHHLWAVYGITCNTPFTQFSLDMSKLPIILSKFYMMDILEPKAYLELYPWQYALPDYVINKLAYELGPKTSPMTFEQYRDYFNMIVAKKAQPQMNNGKYLMTRAVAK